jgi:hypothetical protein
MRTLRKAALLGLCAGIIFMVSGCAVGYMAYGQRSMKPNVNSASITQYESTDYKVLGKVTATGESKCLLGIIVSGNEGEGLLWDAAQAKFGDKATGLKDVDASYNYQAIMPPIYATIKTTYTGIAVSE